MAEYYYAFFLTSAILLYTLVVFVFSFTKIRATKVKDIFRMFFFSLLLFTVSQISLLVATVSTGFKFDFFVTVNSFFSFVLSIFVVMAIMEAEKFSKEILSGANHK
jgi:hypothetical protein